MRLQVGLYSYRSPYLSESYQFHNVSTDGDETTYSLFTVFENYSKCRIIIFLILALSTNFCPIISDLSGNTVLLQASDFQKLANMEIFGHF